MSKIAQYRLIDLIAFFNSNFKDATIRNLMCFLHVLDYYHLREIGRPVTTLSYQANILGPISDDLANAMKEEKAGYEFLYSLVSVDFPVNFLQSTYKINHDYLGDHITTRQERILLDLVSDYGETANMLAIASRHWTMPWHQIYWSNRNRDEVIPPEQAFVGLREEGVLREMYAEHLSMHRGVKVD